MEQFPEANEIFNVFIVVFSTAQLFNIIPTRFHQHINSMCAVHDFIFESAFARGCESPESELGQSMCLVRVHRFFAPS